MSNDSERTYLRNQWVDLKAAADQSDMHPDTLRKMAQKGRVRARLIGKEDRRKAGGAKTGEARDNTKEGVWRVWMDDEGLPGIPGAAMFDGAACRCSPRRAA